MRLNTIILLSFLLACIALCNAASQFEEKSFMNGPAESPQFMHDIDQFAGEHGIRVKRQWGYYPRYYGGYRGGWGRRRGYGGWRRRRWGGRRGYGRRYRGYYGGYYG
ncbi:hypothetical protein M3Y97_00628200 [Aphelenchoides bicaudatus]|nr:hypothetical protein M3Y97_00628200 [Aphelenchoides bicaudatus]